MNEGEFIFQPSSHYFCDYLGKRSRAAIFSLERVNQFSRSFFVPDDIKTSKEFQNLLEVEVVNVSG